MTDQHKGNTLGLISHEAMLHYVRVALPNRHQAKWQENILTFFFNVFALLRIPRRGCVLVRFHYVTRALHFLSLFRGDILC